MNGIYLVDKEATWTSFDVVAKLRRRFNVKKIGHSGTLDPFATGLLLLLVGKKATKITPYLNLLPKTYVATLKLGETTSTLDSDSPIISTKDVPLLTTNDIEKVLQSFSGKQCQVPPLTSAIKVAGVPLYKYAHRGEEIEVPKREVFIHEITLLKYDATNQTIIFEANVGSGTYIRTLGQDIALKLGTVGYLTALRRTKIGHFAVEDAKSVEQITLDDARPIIDGLKDFPLFQINNEEAARIKNGQKLQLETDLHDMIVVDEEGEAVAHLHYDEENKNYRIVRGLF